SSEEAGFGAGAVDDSVVGAAPEAAGAGAVVDAGTREDSGAPARPFAGTSAPSLMTVDAAAAATGRGSTGAISRGAAVATAGAADAARGRVSARLCADAPPLTPTSRPDACRDHQTPATARAVSPMHASAAEARNRPRPSPPLGHGRAAMTRNPPRFSTCLSR